MESAKSVLPNCARVDLVADSYDENSIKATERQRCGFGDKSLNKIKDSSKFPIISQKFSK